MGSKLVCPGCIKPKPSKVITTHINQTHNYLRRRRKCLGCGTEYLTAEVFLDHYNRSMKYRSFFKKMVVLLLAEVGLQLVMETVSGENKKEDKNNA